tara:strand:- start:260 stop:895 length:636 start_codon:yes stop_codon:yes gene_type:complete
MKENVKLFKAIADFQQEAPVILRDTDGYGYKYATFDHIAAQIKPLLKKFKLGYSQIPEGSGLKTIIFHTECGEFIDGTVDIPNIDMKGMNKYQSFGAGITYFRRYALTSMLGILSDKDIDAEIYKREEVKETINPKVDKFVLDLREKSTSDNNYMGILKYIVENNKKTADKKLSLEKLILKFAGKYDGKAYDEKGKEVALKTIVTKYNGNV